MNAPDNPELCQKYRIRAVPTFVYVVDGKEVRRHTGSASETMLKLLYRPTLF